MANEIDDRIECETHGSAGLAYVCAHLIANPVQRWHCSAPSAEDPHPDAWCSLCNVAYEQEGEWNEENEDSVPLELLCEHCYRSLSMQSVGHLVDQEMAAWQDYISQCQSELKRKQASITTEFSLNDHERWDWHQETAQLIFSNGGKPAVIADIQFVGTLSSITHTWLWSWANFDLLESVRTKTLEIHAFGERRAFPHLTVPQWPAEQIDGWEMSAIATSVLDAKGVYRTPDENGLTFMVITDIHKVQ